MTNPKIDKAQARTLAWKYERGKALTELAREFGVSVWMVRAALKRSGVKLRSRGGRPKEFSVRQASKAADLYRAGQSVERIAAEFGVGPRTIARVLRQFGVEMRQRNASGPDHGNYRGGRVNFSGYTAVLLSRDDPFHVMASTTNYCMEHRLVMARAIGRPLHRHETVHHINGDITDNRLANLQLRFGRHGKGVAMVCSDCGSRNIAYEALDGPCD